MGFDDADGRDADDSHPDIVRVASRDDDDGNPCEGYEIGAACVGAGAQALAESDAGAGHFLEANRGGGAPGGSVDTDEEASFQDESDGEKQMGGDSRPVSPHVDASLTKDCEKSQSQQRFKQKPLETQPQTNTLPQQPQRYPQHQHQPQLQPQPQPQPQPQKPQPRSPYPGQQSPPRLLPQSQPPLSPPSSANSLMLDLSALEHSLGDEVSSVKGWMARVRAERDCLRGEAQERRAEAARLRAELGRSAARHQREAAARERAVARDHAAWERLKAQQREQLDGYRDTVAALEEALAKEKAASALRETNVLEQCQREHCEKLDAATAKLQNKLQEVRAARESALEEERAAHAVTAAALKAANEEREQMRSELAEKHREKEQAECCQRDRAKEHRAAIAVLEDKLLKDLREMTDQKENELEEERAAHTKTAEDLKAANEEKKQIVRELNDRAGLERERDEECQKEHAEELKMTIADLENKFQKDLREMTTQKERELEEEREAHAATVCRKETALEEEQEAHAATLKDLEAAVQEQERIRKEMDNRAAVAIAAAQEGLDAARDELETRTRDRDALRDELQNALDARRDLASRLEDATTKVSDLDRETLRLRREQDRVQEEAGELATRLAAATAERDAALAAFSEARVSVPLIPLMALDDARKSVQRLRQANAALRKETHEQQADFENLNGALCHANQYVEEGKREINRLQQRLEKVTGDIVQQCQSSVSDGNYQEDGGFDDASKEAMELPAAIDLL